VISRAFSKRASQSYVQMCSGLGMSPVARRCMGSDDAARHVTGPSTDSETATSSPGDSYTSVVDVVEGGVVDVDVGVVVAPAASEAAVTGVLPELNPQLASTAANPITVSRRRAPCCISIPSNQPS
jgi:hypothetical protein